MPSNRKHHPLDNLTFTAPKLDESPPPTTAPAAAPAKAESPPQPSASRSSNVTLPVAVWEWIDAKHAQARSDGGPPLRKAAIIRAVFAAAMSQDVDLTGVESEEEIAARIIRALKQ